MLIGTPKEIKNNEFRVGLTPASVRELTNNGHSVLIEQSAGIGIGATDDNYIASGATIASTAEEVFDKAEMIIKVKEPQANECKMLSEGQILYTYLHLAPDPKQTELLIQSGATCIAYETITGPDNSLPLLAPMSEVAGRLAVQAGAHSLEKPQSGLGVLLGGVPGVAPAEVLIIGGGIVGDNAAVIAQGMGAQVTILDRSIPRLRELDNKYQGSVKCLYSNTATIEELSTKADLVIGAVLIPGAAAPKLLSKDNLKSMKLGSVIVDVAIDQGGCFETSKATTHAEPTYTVNNVIHYCVANMPGAVPKTSTYALNNATLPHALTIANNGWKKALKSDRDLLNGLNVSGGHVTYKAVAEALDLDFKDPLNLL